MKPLIRITTILSCLLLTSCITIQSRDNRTIETLKQTREFISGSLEKVEATLKNSVAQTQPVEEDQLKDMQADRDAILTELDALLTYEQNKEQQ